MMLFALAGMVGLLAAACGSSCQDRAQPARPDRNDRQRARRGPGRRHHAAAQVSVQKYQTVPSQIVPTVALAVEATEEEGRLRRVLEPELRAVGRLPQGGD